MSKNDADSQIDFEVLLQRCADKAYNFAYRLCGNDQDAQDLVQEAFSRGFTHRDKYDPSRPFDAWINRILHNIFIDRVRKYEYKHSVSLDAAPSSQVESSWGDLLNGSDTQPLDDMIKTEEERHLQLALERLPIHYKSVIVLFDIEGRSYEEIGRIMNIPAGTVGSRINQGRALLRKALEQIEKKKWVTTNE